MREKLRVAIVGCGGVFKEHFNAYKRIDNTTVVAVCDINEEVAKRTARKIGVSYYTDVSEMFEAESLDIVSICTPPQTHADIASKAILNGINTVVEKPMTATLEEAYAILNSLKRNPVKFMVIHNWLFSPTYLKARSLIKNGKIGNIIGVDIDLIESRNDPWLRDKHHWVHSLPAGRFSEILPHPIYLLQDLLGKLIVDYVSVQKLDTYPWVPFDDLRIILHSQENIPAEIHITFNSPSRMTFVNVYGSKGILKLTLINQILVFLKGLDKSKTWRGLENINWSFQIFSSTVAGAIRNLFHATKSQHQVCLELFVDSILNDTDPPVTAKDGLETIKVLKQIEDHIRTYANR